MASCVVPETGIGPRLGDDPATSFPFCFRTFYRFSYRFSSPNVNGIPFLFDSGLPSAMIVKIRTVLPIFLALLIYTHEAHLHT